MLVLGAGVVAEQLAAELAGRHDDQFDPRAMRDVRRVVEAHRPRTVVWMSSWDDVDAAEADENRAYLYNAEATINLAAAVMEFDATPILVSTPEVFGQRGGPWAESDEPAPRSVWAESRRRGEVLLARAAPKAVVLRVGPVLTKGLVLERRQLARGIQVAAARRVSPVTIEALALAVRHVVRTNLKGVVHVAPSDPIRERDFYRAITEKLGTEGAVTERESRAIEAPNPAMRSDRIDRPLGPSWRTALDTDTIEELKQPTAAEPWASGVGFVARRHTLKVGDAVRGEGRRAFFVESGKVAIESGGEDSIVKAGDPFVVDGVFQMVALAEAIVFDVEGR